MTASSALVDPPAPMPPAPRGVLWRQEFWLSLLIHGAVLSWLGWPTLRPVDAPLTPMEVYVVDAPVGGTAGHDAAAAPPAAPPPPPPPPVAALPPMRHPSPAAAAALAPVADLAPAPLPRSLRAAPPAALPSTVPPPAADADRGLALRLSEHLRRHQFYPRAARRAGIEGSLLLRLELDGDGRVLQAALVVGSGFAVLDRAALELVSRAAPFPSPRQHAGLEEVGIELPLDYRLATVALVAETP